MPTDTTRSEKEQALLHSWRHEAERPVEGWDFSHLDGRMDQDQPPWDFDTMSRAALESAAHVLDMGTGGGEQLPADGQPFDCQGHAAVGELGGVG